MRTIIITVLLTVAVSLHCTPLIRLSGYSFLGGYYHPERADKEFSYFDRQDVRFGITGLKRESLEFSLMLSYEESLLRDSLGIHTLSLAYQRTDSWSGSFQILDIGYGKASEEFSRDLTHPEYDRYRLGHFRFTGIRFDHRLSSLARASYRLGGNNHNTSIGTATLSFLFEPLSIDIFYLYTGRDNNFNKTMHSAGSELEFQTGFARLRHAQTWQHLSSNFTISNYLTYGELLWQITEGLQAGNSLFYAERYRGYKHWREFSLLASYNCDNLEKTLQYSRSETGDLTSARMTGIITYSLTNNFSVGLNTAVHLPQTGDNYYSFGLQVKFNEKFAL